MRVWSWRGLCVAACVLTVVACGRVSPDAQVVETSVVGSPTPSSPSTPSSTSSPTTAAPSSGATTDAGAATTGPGAGSSTTDTATAAPATTAVATPERTALVQQMFARLNYTLDDTEAACMATYTSTPVLDAISAGADAAAAGPWAASLVQSLARCEPASWLAEQDAITIEDYGIDATAARCVTKALDAAAVTDVNIARAYFEGTSTLASELQQHLIDSLTPCVGKATATEIVVT